MLIFPAYVWHSVTPHRGEFHRLSFAMNFTLRWPAGGSCMRGNEGGATSGWGYRGARMASGGEAIRGATIRHNGRHRSNTL